MTERPTPPITSQQLLAIIEPTAAQFKKETEHWIFGCDESLSYCRACAEAKIAELTTANPDEEYLLDGGWDSEGDSRPYCETCHCALSNSYTTYACEQEIDHFEECGLDLESPDDCESLENVIYSLGWPESDGDISDLQRRLRVVVTSAVHKVDEKTEVMP